MLNYRVRTADEGCITEGGEGLLPPHLTAYLGTDQCQQDVCLFVCGSDKDETAVSFKLGNITVVCPGSLKRGSFGIVQLDKVDNPAGSSAWTVTNVSFHKLPVVSIGP